MLNLDRLFELYLNRKDSFKKAEERMKRREEFFEQIKKIDQMGDVSEDYKRALKNSASQALAGKASVNFELMDYYHKKPDFVNFEIIAPMVFLWSDLLEKTYENGILIDLKLSKIKYMKELVMSIFTSGFVLLFLFILAFNNQKIISYLSNLFVVGEDYVGIGFMGICGIVFILFLLFIYLTFSLFDLPRLLK